MMKVGDGTVANETRAPLGKPAQVADPGLGGLLRTNNAYWRSSILHAGVELGLFTALGGGPLPAAEVARKCGTDAGATEVLMVGLVGLGFLEKSGDRYANGVTAQRYLVRGQPDYLGDLVDFLSGMWTAWGGLADVVRTGTCAESAFGPGGRADIDRMDDASLRGFVLAMHNLGVAQASNLARSLDLTAKRRLCDVGGGPGTYSIAACQANPSLSAVVFDLPRVLPITQEIVSQCGLADRISTQAGDFTVDSLGCGNDVILLSKVLHQESPEMCRSILRRSYESLVEGGLVVVHGELLDDERQGPELAAIFAVQALLTCPQGGVYTHGQLKSWMEEVGFTAPEVRWLPGQMSAVIARKPFARQ